MWCDVMLAWSGLEQLFRDPMTFSQFLSKIKSSKTSLTLNYWHNAFTSRCLASYFSLDLVDLLVGDANNWKICQLKNLWNSIKSWVSRFRKVVTMLWYIFHYCQLLLCHFSQMTFSAIHSPPTLLDRTTSTTVVCTSAIDESAIIYCCACATSIPSLMDPMAWSCTASPYKFSNNSVHRL